MIARATHQEETLCAGALGPVHCRAECLGSGPGRKAPQPLPPLVAIPYGPLTSGRALDAGMKKIYTVKTTVLAFLRDGCRDHMRICIIQSCYIPWKGFFDLIGRCDEYVILDRVQYAKRHWHNRNRIKTATGTRWLTIPVATRGRFDQPINEVEIEKSGAGKHWAEQHWRALEFAYKRAPFFALFAPQVQGWYERAAQEPRLTEINELFLRGLADLLGLKTRFTRDTAYPSSGAKTERLLAIARAAGANSYLSGPSARGYFDEAMLSAAGISTEWMSYEGYPEYPQLHGGFEHAVTVLDLLFNTGPEAPRYLRSSV